MYDIDCTAGGFVDDIPLWQADVLVIRGELDKALNLLTQGGHFNCIKYGEFRSTTKKESIFTTFLSRHDENITIALEWAMSVIFDEKVFEAETSGTRYVSIALCVYVPLPGKLKTGYFLYWPIIFKLVSTVSGFFTVFITILKNL